MTEYASFRHMRKTRDSHIPPVRRHQRSLEASACALRLLQTRTTRLPPCWSSRTKHAMLVSFSATYVALGMRECYHPSWSPSTPPCLSKRNCHFLYRPLVMHTVVLPSATATTAQPLRARVWRLSPARRCSRSMAVCRNPRTLPPAAGASVHATKNWQRA